MELNVKQRKILIIGVVLIIVMGLFPPWTYTYKYRTTYSESPAGYGFIATPPRGDGQSQGVKLDISRLILQGIIILIAVGLGVYLIDGRKE